MPLSPFFSDCTILFISEIKPISIQKNKRIKIKCKKISSAVSLSKANISRTKLTINIDVVHISNNFINFYLFYLILCQIFFIENIGQITLCKFNSTCHFDTFIYCNVAIVAIFITVHNYRTMLSVFIILCNISLWLIYYSFQVCTLKCQSYPSPSPISWKPPYYSGFYGLDLFGIHIQLEYHLVQYLSLSDFTHLP